MKIVTFAKLLPQISHSPSCHFKAGASHEALSKVSPHTKLSTNLMVHKTRLLASCLLLCAEGTDGHAYGVRCPGWWLWKATLWNCGGGENRQRFTNLTHNYNIMKYSNLYVICSDSTKCNMSNISLAGFFSGQQSQTSSDRISHLLVDFRPKHGVLPEPGGTSCFLLRISSAPNLF